MSARFCGGSRRTSSGRCALFCRTIAACARHGCCGSACSFTITSAAASCCRRRAPCASREIPAGEPLKPQFTLGFEYSDCWVEDARLVVLNARAAAELGATIATAHALPERERATRESGRSRCRTKRPANVDQIRARTRRQCGGPVGRRRDADRCCRRHGSARGAPCQGQPYRDAPPLRARPLLHLPESRRSHLLLIPFEDDFTLIGTTDQDYIGDPATRRRSDAEIAYLCAAASDYFKTPVTADLVKWSYSGVRPLYDDGASEAQAATRDYVLKLDARRRASRRCLRYSAARSPPIGGSPNRRWRYWRASARAAPRRRLDRARAVAGRRFSGRTVSRTR